FTTDWHFHPAQDLCFCFVAHLFPQIKQQKQKDVFYIPITEDLIWDNSKLEELSAIEDVVMVGYPNGLWDQKNNFPLFRKGITSSHPATDFNDKNVGLVDMACFPGSSGSPIFILNENGYTNKKGTYLGSKRLIFLGVLFKGPQLDAKGELIVEDIPTQQKVSAVTRVMINLGYYIKAAEILAFKPEIEKLISQKQLCNI
ncbi:MAG TPA: serine protease, partial [Candidatus Avalokitesvara rifleensis]|uniref:serine protease n=1 Tax=Candidatus Avalokitesvara rifleensis TaxID=3367620 RepID=UPI004026DE66